MKLAKILGMGALVVMAPLFATTAKAATILCTPVNNTAIDAGVLTTPVVFDCPAYDAPGSDLITSVTLDLFITFQDTNPSNGTHQVMGVATENSAQIANTASSTVTTNADPAIGDGRTIGFFSGTFAKTSGAVANLLALNAFNINVAVSIPGGFTIPANSTISAAFTTVETTGSTVPEPASMVLFGSGLAALAVGARRRRALQS